MDTKIEIISKETVKPSSPTPSHLRIHSFTLIDQLTTGVINLHIPLILFFSTTSKNLTETSLHLKKSLQETLTYFYPLAGRPKDDSYIDCNDAGATYIETCVATSMEEFLHEPTFEKLRQLLPINPNENWVGSRVPEILLIQVNYFQCGGVAIGVCISHVIGDASTLGTFLQSWAAIAREDGFEVDGLITDCRSIFPPVDPQTFSFSSLNDRLSKVVSLEGFVNERFVFTGPKIAALRRNICSMRPNSDLPTRFEALSALILGVLMSITKEKSKDHSANISVDLRKRMMPTLPRQCIGNIFQNTKLKALSNEKGIDYNDLALKIREAVRETNDESARRFYEAGGLLTFLKYLYAELEKKKAIEATGIISFTSWCKLPFYEADFGWGKPTWVTTAWGHNRTAIFLDDKDGEGIEVCLALPSEMMTQFEQNPDVVEYALFTPTK